MNARRQRGFGFLCLFLLGALAMSGLTYLNAQWQEQARQEQGK